MPTIAAVVADANVLLSAAIGKAALRVFTQFAVEVHATDENHREVERYLPRLASKYGLPAELVALQWQALPIEVHPPADYLPRLEQAQQLLAQRDPDDAHPLALALTLSLPLWTNDHDLEGHGVPCYTTAVLLRRLEG